MSDMVDASGDKPFVIVGAGLAGLACAKKLHEAGQRFVICEAADRVGGRVATDVVEGFRLDRGFQVLLTAYPEAQRLLDYKALDLRTFYSGALVRKDGRWHRMADPFRHPLDSVNGVFSPIGSLADKLRVGFQRLKGFDFSRYPDGMSALDALRAEGYGESMIEGFFRAFLGGVFLEGALETSVRKLEFVMHHFARGATAVPALGMEQIPLQLASGLPKDAMKFGTPVVEIAENGVRLASGQWLSARAVVVATDEPVANRLLGMQSADTESNQATSFWFAANTAPMNEAVLLLNGDGAGPANHVAVMSAVSRHYAPEGQHLISVNVVDSRWAQSADLENGVRNQMAEWFGTAAKEWRLLRVDRIAHAVPSQRVIRVTSERVRRGVYRCGDHCGVASIDTALGSGLRAAAALIADVL
jgi:phytoene dehydrogenase-like protein